MLIKNAKIIDFDGEYEADVLIEDGIITKIGSALSGDEVLDIEGNYLLPALIDLNVRPLDDKINSANLMRLAKNAMHGGVATIGLVPDVQPKICDEITLEFVKTQRQSIEILPFVSALRAENALSELSILLKKGGLSIYTSSDINEYLLARIFEYAKMHNVVLHIEPKNSVFRDIGVMNEGEVAFELGLGGISKLEEISEVAKIIEFSDYYEVGVLFKNISTAKSLELIAKSRLCYAEVSIHHLLRSDTACRGYNTFAKLSPPLREEKERKALLLALQEGKIDALTSLHSPKSIVNKDVSFDEAGFGIDALGYYLPLLYTELVKKRVITFSKLVELTSTNLACFVGKKIGKVEEGYSADLVVFDATGQYQVSVPSLYSRVQGAVRTLIKNGAIQEVCE